MVGLKLSDGLFQVPDHPASFELTRSRPPRLALGLAVSKA